MMAKKADLSDDYDNVNHIPNGMAYPDRWAEAARTFRETELAAGRAPRLDQPYGHGQRQAMDVFYPCSSDEPPKGLVIFVHGGYWRRFDRKLWSHLAAGPTAAGWAVVMPSYTLAPNVRISAITSEVVSAIDHAATALFPDTDLPIVLVGHSAGGHLVARMNCVDCTVPPVGGKNKLSSETLDRIVRIVSISPVSDLRPLLQTDINADLRLDEEEAEVESPALHDERHGIPTVVWVGQDERPVFVDQARWLADAWTEGRLHVEPGTHHFDVIDGLADPDSRLTADVLGTDGDGTGTTADEQDLTDLQVRYSTDHILRYEFIWGTGWVSPGGEQASRDLCSSISPAIRGSRVLDVGSGTGGAAFLMADAFGATSVHGVDIAQPMVDLCLERRPEHLKDKVEFLAADFMSPPPAGSALDTPGTFGVVWSRDSFLHIADKDALLKKCLEQLIPGGTILFTDYCMAAKPVSECSADFREYLNGRGYVLYDVSGYGDAMRRVGFVNVKAEDRTEFFVQCLKDELTMLQSNRSTFLDKFTQADYDELEEGWQSKIKWCSNGDMRWGVLQGEKAQHSAPML